MTIRQESLEFTGDHGVMLRGWFLRPAAARLPVPTIVLQGALGGTADALKLVGRRFANAGFGVLAYDHRNLGRSDGHPRQEIDPWLQTKDLRCALTYAENRADVDPTRLGLWGLSSGAANALFVTALDRRVRAVVAAAPPVSGREAVLACRSADEISWLDRAIYDEWHSRWRGNPPAMVPLFGTGTPGEISMFDPPPDLAGRFARFPANNQITLLSMDLVLQMELQPYAARITVPALVVKASRDRVCPPEMIDAFVTRMSGPTELLGLAGGHLDVLLRQLPSVLSASVGFFERRLDPTGRTDDPAAGRVVSSA